MLPRRVPTCALLLTCALSDGAGAQQEPTRTGTGVIAGRISLADGRPAEGARVFAATRRPGTTTLVIVAETTSAWDGRYEITGLPAGAFLVGARPDLEAYARLEHDSPVGRRLSLTEVPEVTLYPGVPESEPGRPVRVFDRVATEGIDIWLGPSPQRYTVSGRVYWPEGRHPGTIAIEFGGAGALRSGIWYVTDPGGVFTLEGVPPGPLVLLAHADSKDGRLIGLAATDVNGHVEEVRIALDRPGTVSGSVVPERGTARVGHGRIALVHTMLDLSPIYPAADAAIGLDGRFEVGGLLGTYTFELKDAPRDLRVTRVLRDGRVLPGNRITIGPGEVIGNIEIVVAGVASPLL
jgi:hypothetical protein